jgi:hypothetical protein
VAVADFEAIEQDELGFKAGCLILRITLLAALLLVFETSAIC